MKLKTLVGFFFLAAALHPSWAQVTVNDGRGAEFSYHPDGESPVIRMDLDVGIRTQSQPTPFLRIFGDGLLLVHYPAYRQNAGNYRLQLGEDELRALLVSLSQKGLMTFEAPAVKDRKIAADRAERDRAVAEGRQVELTYRSDDTLTIIDLALDSYKPTGETTATPNFRKRISWYAVVWDARRYPDIEPLQDLAAAVAELLALASRTDLEKSD